MSESAQRYFPDPEHPIYKAPDLLGELEKVMGDGSVPATLLEFIVERYGELATTRQDVEQLSLNALCADYGIHSAEAFYAHIDRLVQNYGKRGSDSDTTGWILVYADVNGLKWINDNISHGVGDETIRVEAQSIGEVFRLDDGDYSWRDKGDEFRLMIPCNSRKMAEFMMDGNESREGSVSKLKQVVADNMEQKLWKPSGISPPLGFGIGNLAVGWSWTGIDELKDLHNEFTGTGQPGGLSKFVSSVYSEADRLMKIDKRKQKGS